MSDYPKKVFIHEEGPREGFQFEKGPIATERKVELIERLAQTGLEEIQAVSFVNPKRVPGMADADEIVRQIRPFPGVRYTGLWLNEQGLQRAIASEKLYIKGRIGLSASEVFVNRNQNSSFEDMVAGQRAMMGTYARHGIALEYGVVQAAFGCNFQGDIHVSDVLDIVRKLKEIAGETGQRLSRLVLADTMAWAVPGSIHRMVGEVRSCHPELNIILHLHDTRGMGIANALAGLQMGVDTFDSSVGGLGGCPFGAHKGAAGNVCTEDLVFMCEEMGIETGVDLNALIDVACLAEDIVGHQLPGSVKQGGALSVLRQRVASAG
jgi:hydroxymethylglutaryl-CoA lyase